MTDLVGDGSSIDSALRLEDIAGLTISEWVHQIAHACGLDRRFTDVEVEYLLYERTAYPVADTVYVQGQLTELFGRMKETEDE